MWLWDILGWVVRSRWAVSVRIIGDVTVPQSLLPLSAIGKALAKFCGRSGRIDVMGDGAPRVLEIHSNADAVTAVAISLRMTGLERRCRQSLGKAFLKRVLLLVSVRCRLCKEPPMPHTRDARAGVHNAQVQCRMIAKY